MAQGHNGDVISNEVELVVEGQQMSFVRIHRSKAIMFCNGLGRSLAAPT